MVSTKKRLLVLDHFTGTEQTWVGGKAISSNTVHFYFRELSTVASEGHPFSRLGKGNSDIGGGVTIRKVTANPSGGVWVHPQLNTQGPGSGYSYEGPIVAYNRDQTNLGSFDTVTASSNSQLDAAGTTAIARTLPTNPLAGMSQFLGELRDLPKLPDIKLWKDKAHSFRSLFRRSASEHLNYQFGWIPFIKDIASFAKQVKNADATIKQYDRDSGRNIRRRLTFPDVVSTVITDMGTSYGSPVLVTSLYTHPGALTREVKSVTKRWFSGCFTYYLDSGYDPNPSLSSGNRKHIVKRADQLLSKLFGLRFTPETLWQLAPWSWAADWVTNIGDVVHNIVAFQNDGLVMRYGYIMETKSITTTYTLRGLGLVGAQGDVTTSQSFTSVVKTRRRATPYGFGLDSGAFSARQWSIIAALGISNRPRSLG